MYLKRVKDLAISSVIMTTYITCIKDTDEIKITGNIKVIKSKFNLA